jgi:putative hydrolase of the HAD superfamily
MNEARHAVILLDLGGVLWDIRGGRGFLSRLGARLSPAEEMDFWQSSGWLPRLDIGDCTPSEFASSLIAQLDLPVEPKRVLQEFAEIDGGLLPGALELGFEYCYLSHEIGLRKPDPRAFQYAIDDLGVSPERILFLDDRPEHVAAATALGLDAHQAFEVAGVREVLASLNVTL